LLVLGSTQAVGIVGGTASTVNGATSYDGDTNVGDGSTPANLTATQILQNSLTINAGWTVTIAPAIAGNSETLQPPRRPPTRVRSPLQAPATLSIRPAIRFQP
jgi:hypothetical protein